ANIYRHVGKSVFCRCCGPRFWIALDRSTAGDTERASGESGFEITGASSATSDHRLSAGTVCVDDDKCALELFNKSSGLSYSIPASAAPKGAVFISQGGIAKAMP